MLLPPTPVPAVLKHYSPADQLANLGRAPNVGGLKTCSLIQCTKGNHWVSHTIVNWGKGSTSDLATKLNHKQIILWFHSIHCIFCSFQMPVSSASCHEKMWIERYQLAAIIEGIRGDLMGNIWTVLLNYQLLDSFFLFKFFLSTRISLILFKAYPY